MRRPGAEGSRGGALRFPALGRRSQQKADTSPDLPIKVVWHQKSQEEEAEKGGGEERRRRRGEEEEEKRRWPVCAPNNALGVTPATRSGDGFAHGSDYERARNVPGRNPQLPKATMPAAAARRERRSYAP